MPSHTQHIPSSTCKTAAFTLIEMMFVILILSFVVVQIARTQQQKMQAQTIEHAAADMNNWAMAAIGYYTVNNEWPPTTQGSQNALPYLTQNHNSNLATMPTQALCSPFGISATVNGTCGNYAEYQGQQYTPSPPSGFNQANASTNSYFVISVQTSSNNVANLLAAKLQNAWVDTSIEGAPIVYTAITSPAKTNTAQHRGWIVSAGLVSFADSPIPASSGTTNSVGSQINLPNCPQGFEGHVIFSPEQYASASSYWGIHLAQTNAAGLNTDNTSMGSNSVVFSTVYTAGKPATAYAITTNDIPDNSNTDDYKKASTYAGGERHLAYFMTICVPLFTTTSGSFISRNWYTNYVNCDWPQDGQCSLSWLSYLYGQGDSHATCQNMAYSESDCGSNDQSLTTSEGATMGDFKKNTLLGTPDGY